MKSMGDAIVNGVLILVAIGLGFVTLVGCGDTTTPVPPTGHLSTSATTASPSPVLPLAAGEAVDHSSPDPEVPAAYLFTEGMRLQGIRITWKEAREQYPEQTMDAINVIIYVGPKVCPMQRTKAAEMITDAAIGNVPGWTEEYSIKLLTLITKQYC